MISHAADCMPPPRRRHARCFLTSFYPFPVYCVRTLALRLSALCALPLRSLALRFSALPLSRKAPFLRALDEGNSFATFVSRVFFDFFIQLENLAVKLKTVLLNFIRCRLKRLHISRFPQDWSMGIQKKKWNFLSFQGLVSLSNAGIRTSNQT